MSAKTFKGWLFGLVGGLAIGMILLQGDQRRHSLAAQAKQEQTEKTQSGVDSQSPNEKVQSLLKDRVTILKAMLEASKKAQEQGGITMDAVLKLQVRLLRAELDLCTTTQERIALHEKIVEVLKSIEESFVRSAKLTNVFFDLQEARLNRVEAEIALNQAKAQGDHAEK